MAPNIKRLPLAPLPAVLQSMASPNDLYKHLIHIALERSAAVGDGDYRNLPTRVFSLSPTMLTSLEQVAEDHFDGDLKAAFTAMSRAGAEVAMQERVQGAQVQPVDDEGAQLFTPKSPLQASFYSKICQSLQHKRIVFAEASTGIGKGRALVAAAAVKALDLGPGDLTVVSAPTVAIVEQLYKEALTLNNPKVSFAILCGATEFVDDLLLKALLDSEHSHELDPVREWVANGAPPLDMDRPLVKSIGKKAAWLFDDLLQLTRDVDVDTDHLVLTQDMSADSESRKIVQSIRHEVSTATQVVFCTHAMLAVAQVTQWKLMPAPRALLIDEAHLFEQNVSNVNSSKVSLFTLRSALAAFKRQNRFSAKHPASVAHRAATSLSKLLSAFAHTNNGSDIEVASLPATMLLSLQEHITTMVGALKHKSMSDLVLAPGFVKRLEIISQNLARMSQVGLSPLQRTYVTYSQNRFYPSLVGGPLSVAAQLGSIWKAATEGAVLASATLYTPTETGDLKCDYMRSVLNTPLARTDVIQPITDPYLFTCPTLHIPSTESSVALRVGPTEEDRSDWVSAVASVIDEKVLPLSVGGTLVLLTAYSDIQAMKAALLAKNPKLGARLIWMERGESLNSTISRYRHLYASGIMPILLGLGPAWTGLDLSLPDKAAADDYLLTAVVVCRVPVGINDTNTMRSRVSYRGMLPVAQESALTFKQGIGRLIRRSGIDNRHLWVLDARIFDGKPWSAGTANNTAFNSLTASLRRFLKKYKNTVVF